MELLERARMPQRATATAMAPEPEPPAEACAPASVAALAGQLVRLAALLKELESQAHLVHVNYEGASFLEVHRFLQERYAEHLQQFDQVAELVRSLDRFLPMCACGLKEAAPPFQHASSYEGRAMLLAYYVNVEGMGYLAKAIEQLAAEVEAPDVQNVMAELVGSAFKTSWMLKALLR
jgi:DNA-binding ferritin-like protein